MRAKAAALAACPGGDLLTQRQYLRLRETRDQVVREPPGVGAADDVVGQLLGECAAQRGAYTSAKLELAKLWRSIKGYQAILETEDWPRSRSNTFVRSSEETEHE